MTGRSTRTRSARRRGARAGRRPARSTGARRADKYALYEESVQDPDSDVRLAARIFQRHYGRRPHLLREDFCGTAAIACRWVTEHRDNRAWGVDLDPAPLDWARAHHLGALRPDQRARIQLVEGDVRHVRHTRVDVTVAFNFSYFLFQTRREMLDYLRRARSTLRLQGLLLLDVYGGPDAHQTMSEARAHEGFDYVWEQARFDPIHHRAINHIHFEFPDGSALRRAFSYDWRLWTIPELRDLLHEAGFRETEVYWEGTDRRTNEGNGIYRRAERAPDDPAWIAYVVGIR